MILYLAFARSMYVRFFIKTGHPIRVNAELPALSGDIKACVDVLEPFTYEGKVFYSMAGWAFTTTDPAMPPEEYDRQLVLVSEDNNYLFPMETYRRNDVQRAFQHLGMELAFSGFHAEIAAETIRTDSYRIGVVFENPRKGTRFYALTRTLLVRTPNTLSLEKKSVAS